MMGVFFFLFFFSSPPPFSCPLHSQLLESHLLLGSPNKLHLGKVLFSFAVHGTGEEGLHMWYFLLQTLFTSLPSQVCFLFLKALQSKRWGSNDAEGRREKEPFFNCCFYITDEEHSVYDSASVHSGSEQVSQLESCVDVTWRRQGWRRGANAKKLSIEGH